MMVKWYDPWLIMSLKFSPSHLFPSNGCPLTLKLPISQVTKILAVFRGLILSRLIHHFWLFDPKIPQLLLNVGKNIEKHRFLLFDPIVFLCLCSQCLVNPDFYRQKMFRRAPVTSRIICWESRWVMSTTSSRSRSAVDGDGTSPVGPRQS